MIFGFCGWLVPEFLNHRSGGYSKSFHWCKERVCFRCIKRTLISQGTGGLRSHVPLNHLRERWNCLLVDESQDTFFQLGCSAQNKESLKSSGRAGLEADRELLPVGFSAVCCDVPSCMLSVSGGSTSFAFETWVMAQVLPHTKPTCLRSHLSKRWHSLLCWCAPNTPARGQEPEQRQSLALLGCLQLTVPFSHSGSSTFLLTRKQQWRRSCLTVEVGRWGRIFQFLSDSLLKKYGVWVALQLGSALIQLSITHLIQWMLSVKHSEVEIMLSLTKPQLLPNFAWNVWHSRTKMKFLALSVV